MKRKSKVPGREARNEQRKLIAGFLNPIAVAFTIAAFAGQILNPASQDGLTPLVRAGLLGVSVVLHLVARRVLADIEDK